MSMPMITATFRPETGHVVNTDEEFFINVKLHNPELLSGMFPNLELKNCRLSVNSTTNSEIYPKTNGGLPKTIVGNKSLKTEGNPPTQNEWDQEFTLKAGHFPGTAHISYSAIVDVYDNGVLLSGYKDFPVPVTWTESPKHVPITQG